VAICLRAGPIKLAQRQLTSITSSQRSKISAVTNEGENHE
jgi:hypothetical protein